MKYIYPRVLIKKRKEIVSEPIRLVFRMAQNSGEVPVIWRQASVAAQF